MEMKESEIKQVFDSLEIMYPQWKKLNKRNSEIEKTIGRLRSAIATSELKKYYEFENDLKNIEIRDIIQSKNRQWTKIPKDLWAETLKLSFGREFKGESYPIYDMMWVFPDIPEINQKKTWIIVKGNWST